MRICLAQINTTPGDFSGNLERIRDGIAQANVAECHVLLFPELSIPGYLSQDLVYNDAYVDRNLAVLDELIAESTGWYQALHTVVGYIDRNPGVGKPFRNMAGVICNGQLVATYQKQLLPFYDVFDELRYYESGNDLTLLEIDGYKTGIAICEDLWNDKGTDDYRYEDNPFQRYREAGADVILSLNSSPYVHDKAWQRINAIGPGTKGGPAVVYVNQIGGQDELVFDGRSFVVADGQVIHLSDDLVQDSYDVVELDAKPSSLSADELKNRLSSAYADLFDLLVLCLRDYVRKSGFSEVVLASSGGVDSAVVCMIACEAVGPDNVHAIRMPSIYSSAHSRSDAQQLHANLGCWDYEVPIDHLPVIGRVNEDLSKGNDNPVTQALADGRYSSVADENIQARMRDLYVMHFSNAFGAMPLSTGNKTESACGYYTHFDMNFSFAPIKDLYKFQVFDIARAHTEIPRSIWEKPPSAELAEGQTDEKSLLPYAVLDPIVQAHVEDYVSGFDAFLDWLNKVPAEVKISSSRDALNKWVRSSQAPDEYNRIVSLIGRMEYKRRQTCPGTKVSKVAFGIGRRIPIVEKWS